ncbi:MAG: hypothetical protein NDJ89_05185 [Oligoflexia bacterium]|nr:hypothetical protein [Oligoflexia bacterium]
MLKSGLMAALALCLTSSAFAAGLTPDDLHGYVAGKLAVPGPYFAVELSINRNGTYIYREGNMDSVTPNGACFGDYEIRNDVFSGTLWCKDRGDQERIHQEIDLRGITPASLKKGVTAEVRSSALGETPLPFTFRKLQKPFFQD